MTPVAGYLDPEAMTPIQEAAPYRLKRDDLAHVGGMRGGKVRACWALAQGAEGLITAGSRHSPQIAIVAAVARELGVPCRVHTPQGALGPVVLWAQSVGAEVVQHRAGYNSVIVKRANDDAAASGWTLIPFGMECPEAVTLTARQTANLPPEGRLVVAVGSGMSLAGILHGTAPSGRRVLGVIVGADPTGRLDRYAPADWRERCTLVRAREKYQQAVSASLGGVDLDPHYEAKVVPWLIPGDLFWIVGHRERAA